ncbi:cytochrome P450 2B4-like [Tachyglossus aculeatus]|uniref:cytochrome P450 2B4-like n=1 Tax=Tachyglossus aculeatus TaxID=9261 RepID=UPI0018F5E3D1|nr:cytochrome P450 2B4-like [Tachyglossus aculeatus]
MAWAAGPSWLPSSAGSFHLILLLFLVLLLLLFWRGHSPVRLPPGPRALPILGCLPQMWGVPLLDFLLKLRSQFRPVFTVYLGPEPVVVLCGYETVRAALQDQAEEFAGRPYMAISEKTTRSLGISFSQGERWRTLRRFSIMTLRDLGMGRRGIEERVQEEVRCLLEEFHKTQGQPFDPTFPLRRSISNVVCSVVFGRRFDHADPEFGTLLRLLNDNLRRVDSVSVQLYSLSPGLLRHLPGPHNGLFEVFEEQKRFVARMAKEHEASLDPAEPRDFIDAFLIRMQQDRENPLSEFHLENLLVTALDLFFAGTETTSTTLKYGLLLLLKHPQITERVQEEVDTVIGQNREPALEDRTRMPYTDAVIHEIQRFIDIMPLGVPHAVTRETCFQGYTIPKGTMVFPLLHSVLHDPKYFPDPAVFEPKRFLTEDGRFQRNAAFLPFSAGKRACLGEGLARTELFLYFTSILQTFAISSPVHPDAINVEPKFSGFAKVPPAFQLSLTPR